MKTLRSVLPQKGLIDVRYATVYARLAYGVTFWDNPTLAFEVLKLQKRIVMGLTSCKECFTIFGTLALPAKYLVEIYYFVFKKSNRLLF